MFNMAEEIELIGEVRVFQWTNPHCYIQLLVADGNGGQVEWSVEMGAPFYLQNRGWKPNSLRPGDEVIVTLNPLRAGGNAGLGKAVVRGDGQPIGRS
jgi:hypothetical protein